MYFFIVLPQSPYPLSLHTCTLSTNLFWEPFATVKPTPDRCPRKGSLKATTAYPIPAVSGSENAPNKTSAGATSVTGIAGDTTALTSSGHTSTRSGLKFSIGIRRTCVRRTCVRRT